MNYENFVSAVAGICEKYARTNSEMYVHLHIAPEGMTITHGTKEQIRQEWVKQMMAECDNYDVEVVLCDPSRKVLVAHFDDCWDDDNCGHGVAKCSPDDEFDEDIGLAVAFAHFREYEIPDFV